MENKVSIVIPVYNTASYLSKCIESVINQTYKNLEIILVDDGSTDDSSKICDKYGEEDKRIKVIHQKNSGVSVARNNGIKAASGKYITFVDSDDIVDEYYIEYLLNESKNALPVCKIGELGSKRNKSYKCIELKEEDFIELSKLALLNTPCCKLFDLAIIKSNKILFDENLSLGEDMLFNFDYLKHIKLVRVLDIELYYYRKNLNTLSSSYKKDMMDIQIKLFDEFTEFFKDNISDKKLKIFDSSRYEMIVLIVQNEFRNKKISFINRYLNARKVLKNKKMKDMIKEIQYPKKKFFYFLIKYRLVLIYKIINKIISKI